MSYVDDVIELTVKQNPSEPEFHQAVKEVLESLRVVIEANEEEYKKNALLERLVNPERQLKFRNKVNSMDALTILRIAVGLVRL